MVLAFRLSEILNKMFRCRYIGIVVLCQAIICVELYNLLLRALIFLLLIRFEIIVFIKAFQRLHIEAILKGNLFSMKFKILINCLIDVVVLLTILMLKQFVLLILLNKCVAALRWLFLYFRMLLNFDFLFRIRVKKLLVLHVAIVAEDPFASSIRFG